MNTRSQLTASNSSNRFATCTLRIALLASVTLFSFSAVSEVLGQESTKQVDTVSVTEDEDWRPLFNGKDLTGWEQVNCAEETFKVENEMIVCSGIPTGVLRTDRHYENFVLELEWRHLKPEGNAGLFVWSDPLPVVGKPFTRAVEIQILDGRNTDSYTSHGDVFPIQGATFKPDREHPNGWMRCLPSERLANSSPEWNHYRVTCQDGRVELAVNGTVVSGGSKSVPRRGYICLESEGGVANFRNIRIKELPSSSPPADEIAALAIGFESLYSGIDLRGWNASEEQHERWIPNDWILSSKNASKDNAETLWTEEEFGSFELIADWRIIDAKEASGTLGGLMFQGSSKSLIEITGNKNGSGSLVHFVNDELAAQELKDRLRSNKKHDQALGDWNRFEIRVKRNKLTVRLNGELVIDDVEVEGLPGYGPIGLHNNGAAIEFANIYIKGLTSDGE